MARFDESKIKRDDDGKFSEKDGRGGADAAMSKPFDDYGGARKIPEKRLTGGAESGIINYRESGGVRDKKPSVTPLDRENARQLLASKGYPEKGYLAIVDKADVNGYATLDIKTLKPVDPPLKDGYIVSFQVNKEVGKHRDYTPDEYDDYVYECITRTGSMPYLGTYGNAEISFNVKDRKTAMQMAIDYNQKSYFDLAVGDEKINDNYNYETNPTEV